MGKLHSPDLANAMLSTYVEDVFSLGVAQMIPLIFSKIKEKLSEKQPDS